LYYEKDLRNHSSVSINQTGVSIPLVRAIEVLVASNDYAADLCTKHLTEKEIAWMCRFFENGSLSLLERFSWSAS
jgi:hypothetical protein